MNQGWGQPPGQYPPQQPQQPGYPQQPGFGPPPYASMPQGASTLAILALVMGLGSFAGFGIFTAIPAIILGKMELGKIDNGESPPAGRQMAQIGMWAGIVHVGLLVVFGGCCLVYVVGVGVWGASMQPH